MKMEDQAATTLARDCDRMVREIRAIRDGVRDAKTVSKIMLILRLEALETFARRIEDRVALLPAPEATDAGEADHG